MTLTLPSPFESGGLELFVQRAVNQQWVCAPLDWWSAVVTANEVWRRLKLYFENLAPPTEAQLRQMKRSAILVNTARGPLMAMPYNLEVNDSIIYAVEKHSSPEMYQRLADTVAALQAHARSPARRAGRARVCPTPNARYQETGAIALSALRQEPEPLRLIRTAKHSSVYLLRRTRSRSRIGSCPQITMRRKLRPNSMLS